VTIQKGAFWKLAPDRIRTDTASKTKDLPPKITEAEDTAERLRCSQARLLDLLLERLSG